MAQLVYRDVPEELAQAVKVEAAKAGVSAKEWVVRVLSRAVEESPAKIRELCSAERHAEGVEARRKKIAENPPIVNEAPCGKDAGYPSEAPRAAIEALKAICRGELPTKPIAEGVFMGGYVAETPQVEVCPEEGDPMVWNRILRRHQCPTCGYQGKTVR